MSYSHTLAPDEIRELLRIARATLREWVDSERIPPGKPHRAALVAPAAVVVGLTRAGVEVSGVSDRELPLYRAIQEALVAAAEQWADDLDDEATESIAIAITVTIAAGPHRFCEPPRAT